MRYDPQEHLTTPGRAYPQVWRLAVGMVLAFLVYILGVLIYGMAAGYLTNQSWVATAFGGADATPMQTYFVLGSFVAMAAGALAAAAVHRRGLRDLVGGYRRTWQSFWRALSGVAPVVAVMIVLTFLFTDVTPHLAPATWVIFLPLSLVLLFIQVGAEELVFRGYLQSQLAALDLHPFIWIGVPSILFGLAHYDPDTMGDAAPWVVAWAVLFGILVADLTARTGTLGPAIAMHFANNMIALLIFGFPDYLGALALFHMPFAATDTDAILRHLPIDAASMAALYLAIRVRLKV